MHPDTYIQNKKAWKFKRDKEAAAWRTARKAIKEAETPLCAPKSEYSAFVLAGCFLLALGLLLVAGCQTAHAEDITGLKPGIVKALEGTTATVTERTEAHFTAEALKRVELAIKQLSITNDKENN